VSIGEFDGSFIGPWIYPSAFLFQFFHRLWTAEEDMDGFGLFLEFNQIRSGKRQVPCQPQATEDGRGYVNLCPTNVADGANQARRVIVTTNRLVILSAEAPQIAALAKVLWAGIVEMILDLVIQRMGECVAPRCGAIEVKSSAGIPFRRCDYDFGRGFPAPVASALLLRVNQGMGDRCVAVFRPKGFSVIHLSP